MALDPSVILGFQPPNQGQQMNNTLAQAGQIQQIQAQQQQQQNVAAIKNVFADPSNMDPDTGLPTSEGMKKIMGIDPNTGMKLQDNMQSMKGKVIDNYSKMNDVQQKVLKEEVDEAYGVYKDALSRGLSKEEATRLYNQDVVESRKLRVKEGVFSDNLLSRPIPPPEQAKFVSDTIMSHETEQEKSKRDQANKDRDFGFKQQEFGETVRHDKSEEGLRGQELSNQAKREDRMEKMFEQKTERGTFTPEMGELAASLASMGVSLPTGFRSKEQQISLMQGLLDKNPDKTPDQIAEGIKKGQIEFGAQKKETQTAAGMAGKVQVAANELDENIPLARKASQAVPRRKWTDLNKVMQTADEHLSDPNLITLKGYIKSTLNAYDALAARGGTDAEKRAENRKMLLSSNSPEAFEAQLKVFENEARVAKKAAFAATKSPELEDDSGEKPPKSIEEISTISSKDEFDKLPKGAHYSLPGDKPGEYRVK